jgi:hypothetical protein
MRIPFVCLALAFAVGAQPALARDPGSSLTLQSPQGAPARIIIDGAAWVCQGAVCTAAPGGDEQPTERACRRVVRELGPVTAFTWLGRALSPAQIAACNTAAKRT